MSPVQIIFTIVGILIVVGASFGKITRQTHTHNSWVSDSILFDHNSEDLGVSADLFRWPKQSYLPRTKLIGEATGHLDIWIYDITFRNLRDLLVAKNKQTPVRLIIEHDKYKDDGEKIKETLSILKAWGIQVSDDRKLKVNFTHAKTLITDNFVLIQTSNLTKNSFDNNREYYAVVREPAIIRNLQELFDRDRQGIKTSAWQINPNILVCPIDCRTKIQSLIDHAKKSIIIQNQQMNDPNLIALLNQKIAEGIKVQIIVADKEGAESLTPQFPLGIVRKLKKPYPHAKMMLIDDKILKVSSINFTTNSMDNNREIWILIKSPKAIDQFLTNFKADRSVSKR